MTSREPARTPARWARTLTLSALVVVGAVLIGVLGSSSLRSSPSLASPPSIPQPLASDSPSLGPAASSARPSGDPPPPAPPPQDPPLREHRGELGAADGVVLGGVTVFDDEVPAVANLDPALVDAVRRSASDAAGDGVTFVVTSGWRSPAYQEHLLREAVSTHGSEAEAARWVASPDTSAHVSGDAIDLGSEAAAWLSRYGARYGLCGIYDNEPWHYELRPDAVAGGCPVRYADPTHDPRMQR